MIRLQPFGNFLPGWAASWCRFISWREGHLRSHAMQT